jgi:hypothetical protein
LIPIVPFSFSLLRAKTKLEIQQHLLQLNPIR